MDNNNNNKTPKLGDLEKKIQSLEQGAGFQVEDAAPTIIKVIGVGGGGNNAINHMYTQNIEGVSFVVINTDRQALNVSPVPNRLLIGPNTTKGLGAGNMPELAKKAAEESRDDIAELFDEGTKMVFITAGMGGGTGTGAAPVVASIAHQKGVLTIGIVTIPFLFEGQKKILKALAGADEMSKYVDALLIINNQRLTEIYPDLNFENSFAKADDTLSTAARSISELITAKGRINLDFNDVNTTLRNGGVAIISTGYGEGENRVTKAIEDALESPLLKNRDVYGSRKILFNVYFSPNAKNPFKMSEINELQDFMANLNPDVDVIWGVAFDPTLEERVKITVLAAGFAVSLETETTISKPSEHDNAQPKASTKRMEDEYGKQAVSNVATAQLSARYFVFETEELDDDEIIDIVEKTPTFGRKPDFKTQVRERRTTQAPAQPVAQPEQPVKPGKKPSSNSGTINFGG